MVKENNFPFFYAPVQIYETINLKNNVKVYIPENTPKAQGCWITKTPCVSGAEHVSTKKKLGFTIFYRID